MTNRYPRDRKKGFTWSRVEDYYSGLTFWCLSKTNSGKVFRVTLCINPTNEDRSSIARQLRQARRQLANYYSGY